MPALDVLLKKNFWLVHLGVVAVCAGLSGRTAAHFVTQTWLGADEPSGPRSLLVTPVEQVRSKDAEPVIRRNVFCSGCAPISPSAETPAGGEPTSSEPRRTDLQLELVSTMVVPDDERWSMAVVRDLSTKEKDPGLYRNGSPLPGGGAKVLRIIEKKVYLANNGRIEFLELEGATTQATPNPGTMVSMGPPAVASGDPLDGDVARGVRCNGAQCDIDRSLVDKLLANTTMLATAARFVPSIKDGRPNGFKLYAIRPNSIFAKIGLQNGDTVKTINGMEMSSPDQALGVYTKVRSASHLTVAVERRGESTTLDYTIR